MATSYESQNQQVLKKLQTKEKVTLADFPLGFRLSARAHDLRKAGHKIKTQINKDNNMAEYSLIKETV